MTPRGPVFNVSLALPIHLTKDIAIRYIAKKYAPKEIAVSLWHKTWKGKMIDGSTNVPFNDLLSGRKKDMWLDLGVKGGHLKVSFQLQKPDSAVYLPGTVLSSSGAAQHFSQPRPHSVGVNSSGIHAVACEVVVPEQQQQQHQRPVSQSRSTPRSPPLGDESRSFNHFFQQIRDTGIDVEAARRLYRESKYGEDEDEAKEEDEDSQAEEEEEGDENELAPLPPPPPTENVSSSPQVPSAPSTPIDSPSMSNIIRTPQSVTTPQGDIPSAPVVTVVELEELAERCADLPIADPASDSYLAESI